MWVRVLALVILACLLVALIFTYWPKSRSSSAIALAAEKSKPEIAAVLREIDDVVRALVERYPDDPKALAVVARAHYRLNMMKKAETYWHECLELDPDFCPAIHSIASLNQEIGNNTKAAKYFRKALDLNPESPMFSVELSRALMAKGRVREAIGVLEADVKRHPKALGTLAMLGQAHLEDRQYAKAKHYFERAIAVGPNYSGAYHGLVAACAHLGEDEKAKGYAEKLREIKAAEADAHRDRLGEHDDIRETKAVLGEIYSSAAEVYLARNEPRIGERYLLRAIENAPKFTAPHEILAWLYRRQGRKEEAARILQKLLAIAPEDTAAQLSRGKLCTELGWFGEAEAAYQKAIELAPEQAGGYAALAWLYVSHEKKPGKARELAEKSIEQSPLAKYYYLLGVACQINKDRDGAREAIAKAMSLDPSNPEYQRVWRILQEPGDA